MKRSNFCRLEIRVKSLKLLFLLLKVSLVIALLAETQHAQQREGTPAEADIAEMRGELKALGAQQRQIIDELSDLKRLLATNAAVRPAPQPPTPPSAVSTQDEAFRGDSGATVAIVEWCPLIRRVPCPIGGFL